MDLVADRDVLQTNLELIPQQLHGHSGYEERRSTTDVIKRDVIGHYICVQK